MTDITKRGVVLIGAGGSGREAVEVVRAIAAAGGPWQLLGFLDDGAALTGSSVGGAAVLGAIDEATSMPEASFVVCTGSPANYSSRQRIVGRLDLASPRYASLVHPAASLAGSVKIGCGCLIQAGVVATVDVTLGDHVLVMPEVVFTHDDVIDDFVTIGAGAKFAGGVHVEAGAYVGSGVLIREGTTIGAGSLVGMGSVVLCDVPAGEIWCGNPARYLRDAPQTPVAAPLVAAATKGN